MNMSVEGVDNGSGYLSKGSVGGKVDIERVGSCRNGAFEGGLEEKLILRGRVVRESNGTEGECW